MEGQYHYLEAEKILSLLLARDESPAPGNMSRQELLALAQVHATLAVAAAAGNWGNRRAS